MLFDSMEEMLVLILCLDADAAWESTGDGSVLEDQNGAGLGMYYFLSAHATRLI